VGLEDGRSPIETLCFTISSYCQYTAFAIGFVVVVMLDAKDDIIQ